MAATATTLEDIESTCVSSFVLGHQDKQRDTGMSPSLSGNAGSLAMFCYKILDYVHITFITSTMQWCPTPFSYYCFGRSVVQ